MEILARELPKSIRREEKETEKPKSVRLLCKYGTVWESFVRGKENSQLFASGHIQQNPCFG